MARHALAAVLMAAVLVSAAHPAYAALSQVPRRFPPACPGGTIGILALAVSSCLAQPPVHAPGGCISPRRRFQAAVDVQFESIFDPMYVEAVGFEPTNEGEPAAETAARVLPLR